MRSHLRNLVALLAVGGLWGCQSPGTTTATPERNATTTSSRRNHNSSTRDNALALLEDLLNDEKHLSLILIIKHDSRELHRLVKEISEAAGNGAKLLKSMAKKDPRPEPVALDLPLGEQATRDAIAKTKKHLLLHSKDAEFEFQLLLTQAEALSYGIHLAQVAAENEPQPARAREFSNLSAQLNRLYEQVLVMLRKQH